MLSICTPICKHFKKSVRIVPIVCNLCYSNISHLHKLVCGHYLCIKCRGICITNNIQCVVCYKPAVINLSKESAKE